MLPSLDDVAHLGERLVAEGASGSEDARAVNWRELDGPGHLRYVVSAANGRALEAAVLEGASRRLGRTLTRLADLGDDEYLSVPPEEQYLVATGRTYFRGLAFDDLHRMQFDLETTGLDAGCERIFMIAIRDNRGFTAVLDTKDGGLEDTAAEADLLRRFAAVVRERDPDVIENHNLHGFDLPFLARRSEILRVPLALGRWGPAGMRKRPASRGYGPWQRDGGEGGPDGDGREAAMRFTVPGRELIDTMDAVRRYDFAARDLPGHGLKAVARYFGLAPADREYVEGSRTYVTWLADPARVRKYALDDVTEADGVARLLGGSAFALAQMAPRRYERLADAGPATGILDPLIVRAYLRAGQAIPKRAVGDGTTHTGAALHLFATGVAQRVVKADVSSLYPSLMRQYRIGPRPDRLGALLALVDRLVEQRLAAKARAKALPPGSPERHTDEAISAAMKILVNSAYGYMGAVGLTRFADVAAANEVTRRGRAVLGLLCRELDRRGATLLEADTDGVYFAVPEGWGEADERRIVAEVATLLPPLVRLEFEGRYAAMLSHEPKNYALLTYEGKTLLRGVAFRSIRFEPYGEAFLAQAVECLMRGDVVGVREAYEETIRALRRRELASARVAQRVRLTKRPQEYLASQGSRKELPYEAMLAAGRDRWSRGERVRVYRVEGGRAALLPEEEDAPDSRDYDAEYYVRLLRETFASRLAKAFAPEDYAALVAAPEQPSLFDPPMERITPVLTRQGGPPEEVIEVTSWPS